MKRITHFLTLAFVLGSSLVFVWTLVHPTSAAKAEAPAPAAAPQMSSASYALDWAAAGGSSGGESASAHYKLSGTIGQMAASDSSASTNYKACSGFQCVLNALHIYLPLIKR